MLRKQKRRRQAHRPLVLVIKETNRMAERKSLSMRRRRAAPKLRGSAQPAPCRLAHLGRANPFQLCLMSIKGNKNARGTGRPTNNQPRQTPSVPQATRPSTHSCTRSGQAKAQLPCHQLDGEITQPLKILTARPFLKVDLHYLD